jgi:hypothetical protein
MKKELRPRLPTSSEVQIMRDLCEKARDDVMRTLKTTVDLATDAAGMSGLSMLCFRVSYAVLVGAAVAAMTDKSTFKLGRPPETPDEVLRPDDDFLLFSALVMSAMYRSDRKGSALEMAQGWFERLMGHRMEDLPPTWEVVVGKSGIDDG